MSDFPFACSCAECRGRPRYERPVLDYAPETGLMLCDGHEIGGCAWLELTRLDRRRLAQHLLAGNLLEIQRQAVLTAAKHWASAGDEEAAEELRRALWLLGVVEECEARGAMAQLSRESLEAEPC